MICGICKNNQIGVDIQEPYQITGVDKIIQSYFHLDEIKYLESYPEQDRMSHFFSIWTMKEAYLKAVGKGFRGSIREIVLIPREKSINTLVENQLWNIHTINIAPGYSSAIAINGNIKLIKQYTLSPTFK
jgi:phosphopantetheine--protein transferase-like protein